MVEEGGGSQLAVELPESAVAWLDEQAAAHAVTREEFLRRLVGAVRGVDAGGSDPPTGEKLETLAERVTTLEDDVDAKIEDVRERVVQVEREADSKAPADHDHSELAEEIHVATETVERARSALDDLEADLEELRETTAGGFENDEEIPEYLTDTTDDPEEKLTRVAAALVTTRRAVDEYGAGEAERSAVAEIKTAANRHGIGTADCEHSGRRRHRAARRTGLPALRGAGPGCRARARIFRIRDTARRGTLNPGGPTRRRGR